MLRSKMRAAPRCAAPHRAVLRCSACPLVEQQKCVRHVRQLILYVHGHSAAVAATPALAALALVAAHAVVGILLSTQHSQYSTAQDERAHEKPLVSSGIPALPCRAEQSCAGSSVQRITHAVRSQRAHIFEF